MGRFFSDPVELALKYIYYDLRARRGQEGFQLLQQAVQEGDADACCLLARCLYGPEYTWPGHNYGAEKGYPSYFFYYANELYDQENKGEAFDLYRRAAEAGEPRAFFWAGYSYELGEGVPKDAARAAQYYQQALSAPIQEKVNPANRLGMCYYDGRGVERDYAKAFQLLKWAEDHGGPAMLYYLGACYANGQGTQQDYAKAFTYLNRINWNCHPGFYLLGKIYCNGLGVPADIAKGVEYLQKASEVPEAKEELRHYKKTFFGKWVRR